MLNALRKKKRFESRDALNYLTLLSEADELLYIFSELFEEFAYKKIKLGYFQCTPVYYY